MTRANVAFFLLGAALAIVGQGLAGPEVFAEWGQCRFGQAQNGTFYESDPGMDYRNYMTPRCGSVGVQDKFKDSAFGWRIAYLETDLIKAASNIARYGDDLNRQPCDHVTTIGCKAVFNGSGYTYGFSFSLTGEYPLGAVLGHQVKAIGEAGLFFFRHRFRATANCIECAHIELRYDEASSWTAPPAPLLGLTLRSGDVYIAVRRYFEAGHRPLSLTNHTLTQMTIGAVVTRF